MKSLGYLGAFLTGALAGGLAGLLLAPEKGENTRAKLTEGLWKTSARNTISVSVAKTFPIWLTISKTLQRTNQSLPICSRPIRM